MKYTQNEILNKLDCIYEEHSQKYGQSSRHKQMCCMWSVVDPPDIIEDTDPFQDIEDAFDISIEEDDYLELYDMDIEEAVVKIKHIIKKQHNS